MAKVFKIGQDEKETEYLISIWMKLLCKAEAAQRKGQDNQEVLAYMQGLIRCTYRLT
jgi:hypothetical protein